MSLTKSGDAVHVKTSGFAVDIECGADKCRQGRGDPCQSGCKSPAPRIPRMTISPEVQHAKAPGRLRRALAKVWRQMAGAK